MVDYQTSELQTEYVSKKSSKRYIRWIIFAPLGMILVGAGLCVYGFAHKLWLDSQTPTMDWVVFGTLSLALVNAGLAFIGEAVRNKILYDLKKRRRSS
jgi:hypothetical protein